MQDTPPAHSHPYDALTPDLVLDAVEQTGLRCDGRLLALNSFENRVYQVGIEDGPPLVAKFYRPGRWSRDAIQEEHAFALELGRAELPIVVPLRNVDIMGAPLLDLEMGGASRDPRPGATLREHRGFLFALYARQRGRAPELEDRETLLWMGRFIGRIHAIGALRAFQHRPVLDIRTFGEEPAAFVLDHGFIPADLRAAYETLVRRVLTQARECFERAGPVSHIRLHGDCHAGNVLWDDDGPHFVDLDDARSGPAVQDLWMLLSGERAAMEQQLGAVLRGYREFYDFAPRELLLIEALRTLRQIHYAGWLARRWEDPAFPVNFPWFNSQRYWQDHILSLREQAALMQEPPLSPALDAP
ncbi:MAG TPA: serine/threonine protein kinase [Burkholderiales bacterium]|nr:serine/threonine protein kinase [Burkholderiales bacterium]